MPTTDYYIDLGDLGEVHVEVDYDHSPYRCNRRGHIDSWLPDDEEEFEVNGVQLLLDYGRKVSLGGLEALFIKVLSDPNGGFYEMVTSEDAP